MNSDLEQAIDNGARLFEVWAADGRIPWWGVQTAIMIVLFGAAVWLAKRIEPALESRVRHIKQNRDLLRIAAATLRRIHWPIYAGLLMIALAVVRATVGLPATLIQTAFALSLAWFAARVLSRIIRNRLLARAVTWAVWLLAALMILGIADDVATVLDRFALPLGTGRISLLGILKGLVLLAVAIWLAITVGGFFERRLRATQDLTPSMQVLVGKVLKIGLMVLAGAVALSSAGVDLTAFTVLSGAIGVGLGFGLQKVVSNFISGIIILLDKSIKPGDTITVGETFGWIRELRARFVSIVTRDGREYLIPNEDFITQQVINWSFTDELVRLDVNFGASYDDDPHLVSRLAIDAASSVARVESDRTPVCWITDFGDSSVNYVLRFWIHDPQQGLTNVRGRVLLALWDAFKANGISIPFPQREITIRHGQSPEHGRR